MSPNQKLTNVIKGRTVVATSNEAGKMSIVFDDGSTMKIKTGESSTGNAPLPPIEPMQPMSPMKPMAPLLPPLQAKRSDVFRNMKWNEDKAQVDASRLQATSLEHDAALPEIVTPPQNAQSNVATNVATSSASTGGTVKSVLQSGTTMTLQFEDGSKMDVPLQEETSSVMLRDKAGAMEYAD